jgi:hypothetical protein
MIPGAMRFHECYSGPNQLQVLDAVGYEGAECQPFGVLNATDAKL